MVSVSMGARCLDARYLWNAECPAVPLELRPGQMLHTLDAFAWSAQSQTAAATEVVWPEARVVYLFVVASATMAQGEEGSCNLDAGVVDLRRS